MVNGTTVVTRPAVVDKASVVTGGVVGAVCVWTCGVLVTSAVVVAGAFVVAGVVLVLVLRIEEDGKMVVLGASDVAGPSCVEEDAGTVDSFVGTIVEVGGPLGVSTVDVDVDAAVLVCTCGVPVTCPVEVL